MRFGKRVFDVMHACLREERAEREKTAYKQAMWSKVNHWLLDIDAKQDATVILDEHHVTINPTTAGFSAEKTTTP